MLYIAMMLRLSTIAAIAVLTWACAIETVPTPEGTSSDKDRHDASKSKLIKLELVFSSEEPRHLVGLSGATPGAGELQIINANAPGWNGEIPTQPDGSFALPIEASNNDTLELTYIVDGVALETARLLLGIKPDNSSTPPAQGSDGDSENSGATGEPLPAPVSLTATPAAPIAGVVEVSGAGPEPDLLVICTNLDNGFVSSATTDSLGEYVLDIQAATGHQLLVFATKPPSQAGSEPITVAVP
jgi:hypothetical protein